MIVTVSVPRVCLPLTPAGGRVFTGVWSWTRPQHRSAALGPRPCPTVPAKLGAGESRALTPRGASLPPACFCVWPRCPQHGQQSGTSLPLPEAQTARPDQRPLTTPASSKTCPEPLLCIRPTSLTSSAKNCPTPNTLQVRWALLSASEEALSPSRLPAAPGSHQLPVAAPGSLRETSGVRAEGSGQAPSPTACAGPASPGHSVSSYTAVPAHGEAGVPTLQKTPRLKTSPVPCPRSYDRTVVQTCVCRILEGEPVLTPSVDKEQGG